MRTSRPARAQIRAVVVGSAGAPGEGQGVTRGSASTDEGHLTTATGTAATNWVTLY
jgi:hypothetical protein